MNNKLIINKSTIKAGIEARINPNTKKLFTCSSPSSFYLNPFLAIHMGIKTGDYIRLLFCQSTKCFYLMKTKDKSDFKITVDEHNNSTTKRYRFNSTKLRDLLVNHYQVRFDHKLVFLARPTRTNGQYRLELTT